MLVSFSCFTRNRKQTAPDRTLFTLLHTFLPSSLSSHYVRTTLLIPSTPLLLTNLISPNWFARENEFYPPLLYSRDFVRVLSILSTWSLNFYLFDDNISHFEENRFIFFSFEREISKSKLQYRYLSMISSIIFDKSSEIFWSCEIWFDNKWSENWMEACVVSGEQTVFHTRDKSHAWEISCDLGLHSLRKWNELNPSSKYFPNRLICCPEIIQDFSIHSRSFKQEVNCKINSREQFPRIEKFFVPCQIHLVTVSFKILLSKKSWFRQSVSFLLLYLLYNFSCLVRNNKSNDKSK